MSTGGLIVGICGLTDNGTGRLNSARAGKDTAADWLVEQYGFVKVSFADEIKRICMRLWDMSEEQLWGGLKDEPDARYPLCGDVLKTTAIHFCSCGNQYSQVAFQHCPSCNSGPTYSKGLPNMPLLTPRQLMQRLGAEVCRGIDPDVWVRYTMLTVSAILKEGKRYHKVRGLDCGSWSNPAGVVIPDVRFSNEVAAIKSRGGVILCIKRYLPGNSSSCVQDSEICVVDVLAAANMVVTNNGAIENLHKEVDKLIELISTGGCGPGLDVTEKIEM